MSARMQATLTQQQPPSCWHQQCTPAHPRLNAPTAGKHNQQQQHPHHSVAAHSQRRDTLLALLSSAPAGAWAAAAHAAAAVAQPAQRDPTFYSTWPYAKPADILPYIQQAAQPGDAQAVLDAMDTFSQYYP